METNTTALMDLIRDVRSRRTSALDEATIKQTIILRLLQILGWNIYDSDEIKPEYSVGERKVDYSLRYHGQDLVFIEVKNGNEELEQHQQQLLEYAFKRGVELAVLTNGRSWWFYLPAARGDWPQRKFFSIDITNQPEEEIATNFTQLLSRENVRSQEALIVARSHHESKQKEKAIETTIPKAWNLLVSEPDSLLIDLISETTERICGYKPLSSHIEAFLKSNRPHLVITESETFKPPPVTARESLRRAATTPRSGYTGSKPKLLRFGDRSYQVHTWRDVLIMVCETLYDAHPKEFRDKVLSLRGTKRSYFSPTGNELREPKKVPRAGIFVETHLNANSIMRLTKKVQRILGDREQIKVDKD